VEFSLRKQDGCDSWVREKKTRQKPHQWFDNASFVAAQHATIDESFGSNLAPERQDERWTHLPPVSDGLLLLFPKFPKKAVVIFSSAQVRVP